MVFVSRAVNQVCGLLVKILSAVTRGFRRSFGLSIPSPELVVGSFTRISQLFTLGSALLGGGAAMMGWRARAIAISLTFSTIAVLTVTAGSSFYPYMGQRAQERERLESALLRPMPDSLPGATPIRFPDHAAPMGATIVGTASMYNPYRTKHKSDDVQTASGELYDPAAWTAAIQIDLREQFGGVRYGKNYHPTYALVESDERKAIVKINDIGPLKPGRVIDLNERSMRYFDPTLQLGLISGVKVTLLPGEDWTPGPIAEQLISVAAVK